MEKKELLKLTENYYAVWKEKDYSAMEKLFTEDVVLIDPTIKTATGINTVMEINKKILNGCSAVKYLKKNIYVDAFSDTSIGEVKFMYNEKTIEVVDIIHFSQEGKISKIIAYVNQA